MRAQRHSIRRVGAATVLLAGLVSATALWLLPVSAEGAPITAESDRTSWAHARVIENFCLDGCPQTQNESVIVHQKNSDRGIFVCELHHPGDRIGRANCVLDAVRYTCGVEPFPRWTIIPAEPSFDFRLGAECTRATSHSLASSMASAISLVTGSYECLRYVRFDDWSPNHTISRRWTASNSGSFGCPG